MLNNKKITSNLEVAGSVDRVAGSVDRTVGCWCDFVTHFFLDLEGSRTKNAVV